MKLYEVTYTHGSYEDFRERSLGIFTELSYAEEIKNKFKNGYNLIKQKYEKRYLELEKIYSEIIEDCDSPLAIEFFDLYDKLSDCLDFNDVYIKEIIANVVNYPDHPFFNVKN